MTMNWGVYWEETPSTVKTWCRRLIRQTAQSFESCKQFNLPTPGAHLLRVRYVSIGPKQKSLSPYTPWPIQSTLFATFNARCRLLGVNRLLICLVFWYVFVLASCEFAEVGNDERRLAFFVLVCITSLLTTQFHRVSSAHRLHLRQHSLPTTHRGRKLNWQCDILNQVPEFAFIPQVWELSWVGASRFD